VDEMKILTASDSSILVDLGETASEAVQRRAVTLTKTLLRLADLRIRNIHPAYASVLIDFDPLHTSHEEMMALVRQLKQVDENLATAPRIVEIPVCYGHEFGLDLDDVAKELGLSAEEAIRKHMAGTYNVSFFGFSPGFAYLSGLAESLQVARLQSPRKLVKAGSVAIAGKQTGVYSVDSPGGWRVLGKTPWRMFDPHANPPTPLELGDQIRFVPITRDEFDHQSLERTR
jgi:inhibitor of KinA